MRLTGEANRGNPIKHSLIFPSMGISPRSRWSNRDDSSYRKQRDGLTKPKRASMQKWRGGRGDAASPFLLIGQFTSIVALTLLFLGVNAVEDGAGEGGALDEDGNSTAPEVDGGLYWGRGSGALAVTFGFGMVSTLTLFRVTLSRSSPRRRKRMAKLWILAMMAATYAIAFR